ncbi:putative mitochondrial chaperone BCS1-B-like [Capsicum annuum]|nr:putative mitochondrial chaperone BCS1-B-like [Capsicum annuum]
MGSHEEIILDVLGRHPMKSLLRFKLDCPLGSKPLHGRVYCCCDGLFFIGIWCKVEEDQPSILLLWNPSTRESVILPSQSEVPQEGYTYGLGYDSTSDDYKILGIDRFDEVPDEILSLKSGIEETSGRMSNVDMSARELSLVFVHVAFHWIGWEQERSIVSFKISDEIYGEIRVATASLHPQKG